MGDGRTGEERKQIDSCIDELLSSISLLLSNELNDFSPKGTLISGRTIANKTQRVYSEKVNRNNH